MGHTTQLRGMTSTLRIRTAITRVGAAMHSCFGLKKIGGLIDKKIKFRTFQKFAVFKCKTTFPPLPPPPPHTHTHIQTTREQLMGIYISCQPWGRALETPGLGIRLPHDTRGFVLVMLLFQGCAGGRGGVGNLAHWHIHF